METSSPQALFNTGFLIGGRYEVVDTIAARLSVSRPGQLLSAVLLAADRRLDGVLVCAKILREENEQHGRSISDMAGRLRFLTQQNILRVFDCGRIEDGLVYIIMEYASSRSLAERLVRPQAAFPFSLVPAVLLQLIDALHYASSQGITHGSLKPENILFDAAGFLKVGDFGMAALRGTEEEGLLRPSIFSAPEGLTGKETADIFSLGMIGMALSLAAFGKPGIPDGAPEAALKNFQSLHGAPSCFRHFIGRCTATRPEERFQSLQESGASLVACISEAGLFPPDRPLVLTFAPLQRGVNRDHLRRLMRIAAATAAAILVFLAILLAGTRIPAVSRRVGRLLFAVETRFHTDLTAARSLFAAGVNPADFFPAIQAGDEQKVAFLLQSGVPADSKDLRGSPALVLAVKAGRSKIVHLLLREGASPNGADAAGKTALMYAAAGGKEELVRLLLSKGADAQLKDSTGATALSYAAKRGSVDAVDQLLKAGAPLAGRDNMNWTPLMRAAAAGKREAVLLLLSAGGDPNESDAAGATALLYAARNGHEGTVQALLEHGANPDQTDEKGEKPSHYMNRRPASRPTGPATP